MSPMCLTGFWNSGRDLGYSNGLQMFLAEKLARPWLGDNFLATASQGQLFWAFVGAGLQVGADWGLDLALKLNDKLWDGAFAAAYRASEIYMTFWRGEVLEAKMQYDAFWAGMLAESDMAGLLLGQPMFAALNLAREYVMGLGPSPLWDGKNPVQYYLGQYADGTHAEAAADGRTAAFAFDIVAQIAIDVAIEVLTGGAATPALLAEEGGAEAAEAVAVVGSKAAKGAVEALEHIPETGIVVQRAVRQGGHLAEALAEAGQGAQEAAEAARVARVFEEIVSYRKQIGLPTTYTGNRALDKVVTVLEIAGQAFKGYNGWISKTGRTLNQVIEELKNVFGLSGFNMQTPTHAEGMSFFEALRSGFRGKAARLFVDAKFCNSCGANFFGLRPFTKALGIEELTVFIRYPNGHIIKGLYYLK